MLDSQKPSIEIRQGQFSWDLDKEGFYFFGIPSVLLWTNPSMLKMLSPLAHEVGFDMFRLMVAHSSSFGTTEDYHNVVMPLGNGDFVEGLYAWGRVISSIGWGNVELKEYDIENKRAAVRIKNPWELSMQAHEEKHWGCPFLQGKMMGLFSAAFGVNCWAYERDIYINKEELSENYVDFYLEPSEKTITKELEALRLQRMQEKERLLTEEVQRKTEEIEIVNTKLEEYAKELEQKVEERTLQLRETIEEINQTNEELNTTLEMVEVERAKSEKLLLNILPESIAQELKNYGFASPKRFDKATVLFTDFKGFTQIVSTMKPEQVLDNLNYCFTAFDKIIRKHNLEKIKTIGDAYMCVAGLPIADEDNPVRAIHAALEILAFIQDWKAKKTKQGKETWDVRIGIHTGSVVAGVVGDYKFAYDIWGDAVNIAARMESSGEESRINISEDTYLLVKDIFNCTYRGELEAKNKGKVKMYFVDSIK
jgi:class 3 adenylate cyclase